MEILGTTRSVYLEIVEKYVNKELDKENIVYYTIVSSYFDKVLSHSKKGNLHLAKYYLDIGDGLSDIEDTSLKSWIDFYTLPKKAFFFFKSGHLKQAEILTIQALALCDRLYHRGFRIVYFASIQQRFNFARVLICSERVSMGLEVCSRCLIMLLEKDYSSLIDEVKVDVFEQMVIANMYQIICKAMNLLLDKVVFFFEDSTRLLINGLLGEFLLHANFECRSIDAKYLELKNFTSLFSDFLKRDDNFFRLKASTMMLSIQDESLKSVLFRCLYSEQEV